MRGSPALGFTNSGASMPAAASSCRMSSVARGPTPQLTPTTSAPPGPASSLATSLGDSPAGVVSADTKSSAAITGRSVTARTASRAIRTSSSEGNVSSTSTSTPPSTSAPTCSRTASPAASGVTLPTARSRPKGLIEPPMKAGAPMISRASRAMRAAWKFTSRTRSP